MTTKEIILKTDINDIREIYFRGNKQKYFFGPETKRQSVYLVLFIVIYPFFAVHALQSNDRWYFVFGSIFFSFLVYDFWRVAKPIIKWKKSILSFLKRIEKVEVMKLKYNDDYFIHIEDNKELKQEWSVIDRALINDRFIWLFSNTNILIPRSSMSEDEFIALSKTVMNKVKNVEKNNFNQ